MSNQTVKKVVSDTRRNRGTGFMLAMAGALTGLPMASATAQPADETPADKMRLGGVVIDFLPVHPDFDVMNTSAFGHYAKNIGPALDLNGRPVFTGGGREVMEQWYDKDDNPISPYGDPGLFGGHFDVDVFDAPIVKRRYHEHEFDDIYDVTYVDIANDPKLLFDEIIGSDYPNELRVVMLNVHNGGAGTYSFEANGTLVTGETADGFETTFTPSQLTRFQINFLSLDDMRATRPRVSQDDVEDRDDALSIRMYDTITSELVYELTVYYHRDGELPMPTPAEGDDSCGVSLDDSVGAFGTASSGAVTDEASFGQWFRYVPGMNVAQSHTITLERNEEGVYEYLTTNFFPIDGALFGNGAEAHNEFFTYAISATFVHSACTNKFFEFEGNDDSWLFINGQMVLDIGGVATPSRQFVAMDRLDLVDGQEYTLKFFYAHRLSAPESVFRMRTNLELKTRSIGTPTYSAID